MRWREKFFWWKICENELGDNIPYTLCIPQPQPFYNFLGEGVLGQHIAGETVVSVCDGAPEAVKFQQTGRVSLHSCSAAWVIWGGH